MQSSRRESSSSSFQDGTFKTELLRRNLKARIFKIEPPKLLDQQRSALQIQSQVATMQAIRRYMPLALIRSQEDQKFKIQILKNAASSLASSERVLREQFKLQFG